MQEQTPDRLTAQKGDPNAKTSGSQLERPSKRTSLGRLNMLARVRQNSCDAGHATID
jgi:hypothetical protein